MNKEKEDIPVIPVEEVSPTIEQETKHEYTEEEKKQIDAFYDAMMRRQLRPRVWEVSHYMDLTGKNLNQVYADIEAKKSGLSNLDRSFLTSFERSFINDLFNKKYL